MPIPVEVPKMPSVHDMLLARELNRPGEHFVYSESLKFFPQNDIDIHIDTSPKSVLRGRLGGRMSISSGRFGLTSADLNQARYCGRGEYAQYGRVVSPSNEGSATMSVPVLTSRPDSAPPQIPGWIKGVTATYEVAAVAASLRQRTLGGKLLAFGEFNAIPLIGLACASPSFTEAAPTKEPSAIVQQGVTIESPSTPQPEPSVIPEGPNSPNVQVDAQSNPLPSFEEVVIIGSESFRVVPQEEYIGWGIDAGAQAQVDAIKTKVPEGTVIQVVQSGDQWAVASVSKSGYYLPADADGKLKTSPYFRPDWVSSDVRGDYVFIADGLGTDVVRGAVLVNSHWRSVAMKDGKIVAMVDVKPDGTYEIRYSKDVTPDPLMGAPEGATGKNAKGEWIKAVTAETGKTFEYTWDTERESWYRQIFTGYTLDRPQEINESGYPDDHLMTMYIDGSIEDELSIPTLSHNENIDPANTVNFSARYFTHMVNAVKNRGLIKTISEFNKPNFDSHKFYLDFVNADGLQRWGLWPGTTVDVHIRGDYDALKAGIASNGFFETQKRTDYGPVNSYMLKIWADTNNNLHVDIAPSIPATEWTEAMFYEMAFIGPGNVFESEDLTHPQSRRITSEFILGRHKWPYFTFGSPQ